MLRRKSDVTATPPRRVVDMDVDELPKFDDELSPREVMARLTDKIEKKIEDSFRQHHSVSR